MSWFKKAKLAAQKVVDTASKTAKDLADEVESEFGGETWYEGAKKTATQIGVETNKLYQGSKEFGSDIVQELGSTELGKNVGDKTRVAAQFLSQLPVFSLAHDVLKSRHGIKALYTSFQDNPHDPLRALWLAEALGRVHSDLKVYSGIRSVISPSYALISQSLKLASKLGDEPTDPTQIRLLKHAFSLSLRRLKENPRDAVALHILARIYLVQNDPVEAVYFSKLAIVANTSDSNPWITLSRAYLALEQLNNARRAADKAVNFGQQYGREILEGCCCVVGRKGGLWRSK